MNMNRSFFLSFVVLAAMLIGLAVVHGSWTERWTTLSDSAEVTEQLGQVPKLFGAWVGEPVDADRIKLPRIEIPNTQVYRFVNQQDGNVLSVMLHAGRPGPLVLKHLPTECYVAAGYELAEGPKRFVAQRSDDHITDEFQVARFSKTTDASPVHLRVYWAWSATGQWQIPDRPRLAFARYPILFRMQVVQPLASANDPFDGAPAHEFLPKFTAALRKKLFAEAQ